MSFGWDDEWADARRVVDPGEELEPVRIAAEHRGAYHALGSGGIAWVELTGKTFHDAADKRALPTVGDWVVVERWRDALAGSGAAVVRAILPRRSLLVRRAAGEATVPQPLAANIDVGLVVTSANTDLSLPRLDRYIGLLRDGGIEPTIVVSKLDLVADPAAIVARAAAAGAPAIGASIISGDGIAELRLLGGEGRTGILLGSSGVGKSSLLNAIAGTAQATREIRADERGVHTTTRRELFVASDGGLWIDTPGMRELAQWIDSDDESAFDDITELAAGCRFRDCAHRDEPGCAVRGHVAAERLVSFHKLAGERRERAAQQSTAARITQRRKKKSAPSDPSEP